MKLWKYLDVDTLERHIDCGLVTCKFHKDFPELMILSYGREAVLQQHWDDVTQKCRGLIVNMTTGEIIARPFPKFFDCDEVGKPDTYSAILEAEPTQPTVAEKLNGSLGILYVHKGVHSIASKASFHSKHADWATDWYRKHIPDPCWPIGYTPVFEMICQDIQPHTVQYEHDGLYLIALVRNEDGEELGYTDLNFYAAANGVGLPRRFWKTLAEARDDNRSGEEGYVLSWWRKGAPPHRVRVKFPEFLRRRALFNRIGARQVFEQLRDFGELPNLWLDASMPHLVKRIREWESQLREAYNRIWQKSSIALHDALEGCTTRKEFADYFNTNYPDVSPVCFAVQDERNYQRVIWKLVGERFSFEAGENIA